MKPLERQVIVLLHGISGIRFIVFYPTLLPELSLIIRNKALSSTKGFFVMRFLKKLRTSELYG
jgi:hypothetical protein